MFLYFLVSNHLPGPSWPLLPSTAHERDKERRGKEKGTEKKCVSYSEQIQDWEDKRRQVGGSIQVGKKSRGQEQMTDRGERGEGDTYAGI